MPKKTITQMQYRPLASLKKHPKNPRTIKDDSFRKLVDSIDANPDYFEARPIILSDRTGELIIIAGNQRYTAAKEIGIKDVPTVLIPALTEEKEREIMIRDNISNGDWDFDLLAADWDSSDLQEWGLDVPDWGESESYEGNTDPDDVPEPEPEPVTQLGDLWLLGEHRLLCGDSSDEGSKSRLIDHTLKYMCLTDPPYGVSCDKGFSGAGGFVAGKPIKRREYHDDWDSKIPEKEHLMLWINSAERSIVFGGNFFAHYLPPSKHWIVWDKKNTMPTFGDAELAWTDINRKSVKIKEHQYNGLIGKEKERLHPTQKPVDLIADILTEYVEDDSIVCDPFLGSGTTLIACEKTNRKCYGLELSPQYCDVIVKRWQDFTGQQATLETGETYAEVKESRLGVVV